ncbi:MAG TPA: alcohol dehydrogenase [Candidatus Latescibacteria bacterium]|nr:alcohol dehydrogenase [Candidatus Handelsmanbacteria bacterium]HIL07785.1 alcohol dehydrogenase [Candidatus Latescibacterota bacterium]
MLGIWLESGRIEVRRKLQLPERRAGEALVRVLRAGICNTDLELVKGYYPYRGVLGHEFVGVVEEGPAGLVGERVVGDINAACGDCTTCRSGRATHCPTRTVLGIVGRDGAFAEYLVLPEENLHRVPKEIDTDVATFVEPLAAALAIQQQVTIRPGDKVLLLGDGKLGQLIAQTLALTGCELLVVGRHPQKLALLSERGITTGTAEDVEAGAFDVAVECTGNAEGFALAHRSLRPRGTLVLKSTYAGKLALDASALVVDEIAVVGSRCGSFAPALRTLAAGRVEVEPLIQARFSLQDGLKAFAKARERHCLKVLLNIGEI